MLLSAALHLKFDTARELKCFVFVNWTTYTQRIVIAFGFYCSQMFILAYNVNIITKYLQKHFFEEATWNLIAIYRRAVSECLRYFVFVYKTTSP